jgi:hemolysin-activating ACP:hemolysin acyltransferase
MMVDLEDLCGALQLWTQTAPYSSFPCETIDWRLVPALEHGRYRLYRDGSGLPFGFISWAYMTRHEFETRDYNGLEIFARDGGDFLVFVDMIAPYGRNDVLFICRDMRRLFKEDYPRFDQVLAHRGRRNGMFPNIGG